MHPPCYTASPYATLHPPYAAVVLPGYAPIATSQLLGAPGHLAWWEGRPSSPLQYWPSLQLAGGTTVTSHPLWSFPPLVLSAKWRDSCV